MNKTAPEYPAYMDKYLKMTREQLIAALYQAKKNASMERGRAKKRR